MKRRLIITGLFAGLMWSGCGDPDTTDDCTGRICGSPTDTGTNQDSGTTGDSRVPIPDGGDSGTTGDTSTPPGDSGMGGGDCTSWETANCLSDDTATRTCTDASGTRTETMTLQRLDYNFFRCRVQPILDRGCDQFGCHGTEASLPLPNTGDRPLRVYSRVMLRTDPDLTGNEAAGVTDGLTQEEWCGNYDSARSFYTADAAMSELLTQPLDPTAGGLAHVGATFFNNPSHPDYQTIAMWLGGATLANCNPGPNEVGSMP